MPMVTVHNIQARTGITNDSGTLQIKLPKTGLYTMLEVFIEYTNGATSAKDQDVYGELDRIEVVANGNRVLYSLTGDQARVWSHALLKRRPFYNLSENASTVQTAHIVIPFGLYRYDSELYIDASQYSDLELRITYSPTIAATSFATGTGQITVLGYRWEGGTPSARRGQVKLTEQIYFTSLASGVQYYDLPIGSPLLALGLYVFESGINPHANITDFEVNVDYNKFIPVKGRFEQLNAFFTSLMGINTAQWGEVLKSDTDTIETLTGTCSVVSVDLQEVITTPGTTDHTLYITESIAGGLVTMQSMTLDAAVTAAIGANTTDKLHRWYAESQYGLGNFLVVPFGLHQTNQALVTSDYGNVRVNMTQGNAGAECRLSSMELVPN